MQGNLRRRLTREEALLHDPVRLQCIGRQHQQPPGRKGGAGGGGGGRRRRRRGRSGGEEQVECG
eukprot:NODE_4803_length_763_cov_40.739496_g4006_i0.p2 GENE.NODE_4803_length_763_cov_40.739496_g4006_i0~~NODE_4803_length_763_cov_40.739496_g4006_i0.p2  ORF type:complete len:64 (+),score=3.15 NODE_4803_length_763_cov_40.739496_g4006_i0:410-601(+)